MSNNYMHNQYVYGCLKFYSKQDCTLFAQEGLAIKDYAEMVALDKDPQKIILKKNKTSLLLSLILNILLCRASIVITGARTYILLICAIISFPRKIDIHLHGQFYGAKTSKFKRCIWYFLSRRSNLYLACRFYNDSIPVSKFVAAHDLSETAKMYVINRSPDVSQKIVGVISGNGRKKWKGFEKISLLESAGYTVKKYVPADNLDAEWPNYLDFMSSITHLYLNPQNDYYFYSPSGIISDSINYNKKILSFDDNFFVHEMVSMGLDNVEIVNQSQQITM